MVKFNTLNFTIFEVYWLNLWFILTYFYQHSQIIEACNHEYYKRLWDKTCEDIMDTYEKEYKLPGKNKY